MSNTKKKKKTAEERNMEIESARMFGKHVSREKAIALLVATLIACALPIILGVRLWNEIPEIVPTGLIGMDGKDDSMPRAVVVFGLPGLMCLLDLICHGQLWLNQQRMTLPSAAVRLVGRWGFPLISVLFCSGMVLEATGGTLTLPFVTPCVLGLVLLLLGAHMWDCPRDARVALRFSFTECSEEAWKAVHRFAGWLWLAVGLLVIAGVMLTSGSTISTAALIIVALAAPMVYGHIRQNH